ncbi:carboxymuconolactone decarboxylase family protein [Neptunitalea lumnitzerae]|uniref:Alkyl hydroperoxide reductase AhpD n=1 Tax=Neptunitalea lumnitzerae TaxID=2965509 RepID=A0ABQ5MJ45_9FLAO|nr:carboxymuconolactone decarboxylase family protein [Neptunitalea sp. Y10]GLB49433.1 alkyl hydroperoxide reductase AhpD [Neptunitalea sp. Y10]
MSIKADYNQSLAELPEIYPHLSNNVPEVFKTFASLQKVTLKEGALDKKTKELIASALAVAARCEGCITVHVHDCVKLGCTLEEFSEMIGVAILMGGGPSHFYGAKALQAFETFQQKYQ